MTRRPTLDEADVDRPQHVLHPGERRQQALRPPRPPEGAEGRPARACRSSVGGCLAQKDRDAVRRAGAARRRRVRHPQRRTGRPSCWPRPPATGPITEILEATVADDAAAFPSALPVRARGRLRGLGHDPDRLRQQLRLLHRARACGAPRSAGRSTSIVAEVEALAADGVVEVTLLGQNVNSYGRDLTLAARRPARRRSGSPELFADLLRRSARVDGIRRVRFTSPHPKDLRPDDHRGHGRRRRRCASTCTCPLQSGSDRVLAAMHRGYTAERYLERLAAARAAVADLAVTTDLIVGFPGETDDDFERTLEVVAEAELRQRLHVHLLAPARHRGRRAAPTGSSPPTSSPSASSACGWSSSAPRSRRHEARVGRVEEVRRRRAQPSRTPP